MGGSVGPPTGEAASPAACAWVLPTGSGVGVGLGGVGAATEVGAGAAVDVETAAGVGSGASAASSPHDIANAARSVSPNGNRTVFFIPLRSPPMFATAQRATDEN